MDIIDLYDTFITLIADLFFLILCIWIIYIYSHIFIQAHNNRKKKSARTDNSPSQTQAATHTNKVVHQRTGLSFVLICIIVEITLLLCIASGIRNHLNLLYEELHPASKITVYVTEYGNDYHASGCAALWNSQIETSLRTAVTRGYSDCERCSTPEYVADYNAVNTFSEYVNGGYASEYFTKHSFFVALAILNITICFPIAIIYYCYQSEAIFERSNIPHIPPQKHSPNPNASKQPVISIGTDILPSVDSAEKLSCSSDPYYTCQLIWRGAQAITESSLYAPNYTKQGYGWAALFYIAVKHIRKQSTVDLIYSRFKTATPTWPNKYFYSGRNTFIAQCAYREFAKELSCSNIDPRTDDGLNRLWSLLSKKLYKWPQAHYKSKEQFFRYADLVIKDSAKYLIK